MDLSKMSDSDLQALASGDMTKVSDAGLQMLAGQSPRALSVNKSEPSYAPDAPGVMESALIGAGRTFDRLGKGAQQMYYGATGNKSAQDALKERAAEDDRIYKTLQEAHPFATGIGESLPSMVIPAGGATSLLGNMGRMAVAAGVPAALEYGSPQERAMKASQAAAAAGLFPALLAGAGAVGKTAKALVEPLYASGRNEVVGRMMNRVSGENAPNVMQKLASAAPLVPGSEPTAAQVAESGGIAALERMARSANPEQFGARDMEQAAARVAALRNIAGDDMAIAAQEAARKAATKPFYDQAKNATYFVDGQLQDLLSRPVVTKAMTRAENIAKNEGRPFGFSTTASAPFSGVGGPAAVTKSNITGRGIQDLKMALDDMLKDPSSGIVGKEATQARNLRGNIVDWMENANPDFRNARQTYAQMSQPINQMQVGQQLLTKLQPALSDYGALGKETAATFAKQLRDSDAMVRKATGFKGAPSLDVLMGPEKMGALTAIAQDLGRKTNAQGLGGSIGSDTFQKLAMNNIAAQSGAPDAIGSVLGQPVISRAMKYIYRDADQKMQETIADAMLNPAKAAKLMETKPELFANNPKLKQLLLQAAYRGGIAAPYVAQQ